MSVDMFWRFLEGILTWVNLQWKLMKRNCRQQKQNTQKKKNTTKKTKQKKKKKKTTTTKTNKQTNKLINHNRSPLSNDQYLLTEGLEPVLQVLNP